MSAESRTATLVARYATRGALIYYALVLPAIVAEALFTTAVSSSPEGLVTQASSIGGIVSVVVPVLPALILVVSLYAIVTFRPSLLIMLLIVSFFLASSVASGITVLGTTLDLGATVVLVIAATFLSLVGFNYARGLKLLGGRLPDVESSGPFGYNVLGIAIESAFPLAMAVALVVLVEFVVGSLTVQAAHLPQPLSALASLYLQTRIGLVFTTLLVAGATIWVLRQFIEPVILHFTLSAADGRKELLMEIEPTTKTVRRIMRYRPSGGLAWGVMMVLYCSALVAAFAALLPQAQFSKDLLAALGVQPPSHSPVEVLVQSSIQNGLQRIDILFAQSQDYLRGIIRLLWG
jgi:hypothetical protein